MSCSCRRSQSASATHREGRQSGSVSPSDSGSYLGLMESVRPSSPVRSGHLATDTRNFNFSFPGPLLLSAKTRINIHFVARFVRLDGRGLPL